MCKDGRVLAFVTGLVPCPLTTFIMVYATAQGIIAAGLLVTRHGRWNAYSRSRPCCCMNGS